VDPVFDSSQASLKIRVPDIGSRLICLLTIKSGELQSFQIVAQQMEQAGPWPAVSLFRGTGAADDVPESDGSLKTSPQRSLSNALVTGRPAGNY